MAAVRMLLYVCVSVCVDLGPGVWHAEVVSNRSREHSSWCGCESTAAVLVLRRWGQTGQVLGFRIQQGITRL